MDEDERFEGLVFPVIEGGAGGGGEVAVLHRAGFEVGERHGGGRGKEWREVGWTGLEVRDSRKFGEALEMGSAELPGDAGAHAWWARVRV